MTNKTFTRSDIANALYRELGFSHADAFKLIDCTLNVMIDAFAAGEEVKIAHFASFQLRSKSKRIGRNPKTGVSHVITPRTVISFRASPFLKRAVLKAG